MKYTIGTRGSKLALTQTETVRDALQAAFPEHTFEIAIVKTTGDRVQNIPLKDVGATGIFTRELEEKLRSGEIDIAIHSMKDMPAVQPDGLTLSNVLHRADPRDVLITPEGKSLAQLPEGAVIATGSLRREYQLLVQRPDLHITGIRGNIDTRIRKMEEQGLDGIILAAAALKRLGLEKKISQFFSAEELLPAPTQGILGAEYVTERQDIAAMIQAIRDPDDFQCANAERKFLEIMHVGCHMPVAAYCQKIGGDLRLCVMYGREDGSNMQFADECGRDPLELAARVAKKLQP